MIRRPNMTSHDHGNVRSRWRESLTKAARMQRICWLFQVILSFFLSCHRLSFVRLFIHGFIYFEIWSTFSYRCVDIGCPTSTPHDNIWRDHCVRTLFYTPREKIRVLFRGTVTHIFAVRDEENSDFTSHERIPSTTGSNQHWGAVAKPIIDP